LLGIHPEWRHSPPTRSRSINAVLAPDRFAAEAATRPAEPAPITQISYSFIHPSSDIFHQGFIIIVLYANTNNIRRFQMLWSGLECLPEIFRDPFQNTSHYCGILYTSYLEMQNLKQSGIFSTLELSKNYTGKKTGRSTLLVRTSFLVKSWN
jgi:hypothetical protein